MRVGLKLEEMKGTRKGKMLNAIKCNIVLRVEADVDVVDKFNLFLKRQKI